MTEEIETFNDKFGNPINVGDEVIYTVGGQGHTGLHVGRVCDFTNGRYPGVEIISDKGRKLSNVRRGAELILFRPYKKEYPWCFI